MFAKIANITEDLRKTSYARLYTDELYFYTEVAEVFREIENRHNVPEEDRFLLPTFYGGDPTPGEETIILEDLSHKGFVCYKQLEPYDWDYASKVAEQLAKFHALSFVYSVESPSKFAELLESKPYHVFDSPLMKQLGFEVTVPASVDMLKGHEELQQRVQHYLAQKDRHSELVNVYKRVTTCVLSHGDFKTNNLMYRYHEGRLEVIPVDFQNIHAGNPATDLIYFVALGSNEEFHGGYLHRLLRHYYTQLTLALARMKVRAQDVYPETMFEKDWLEARPIGLDLALMILPITLAPPEGADEANTKLAKGILSSRIRGIVRLYIKWGIL